MINADLIRDDTPDKLLRCLIDQEIDHPIMRAQIRGAASAFGMIYSHTNHYVTAQSASRTDGRLAIVMRLMKIPRKDKTHTVLKQFIFDTSPPMIEVAQQLADQMGITLDQARAATDQLEVGERVEMGDGTIVIQTEDGQQIITEKEQEILKGNTSFMKPEKGDA